MTKQGTVLTKNEEVRKLMDLVDLNEDERDDDGIIFDLKQTILFSQLSTAQQQEINSQWYELSVEEVEESLSIKQCVTIDTSEERPVLRHNGFQLYDSDLGLEKHLEFDKECQVACDWASSLVTILFNRSHEEIDQYVIEKITSQFGLSFEDFSMKRVMVYRDQMNDGLYYGEEEEVIVPNNIVDSLDSVYVDFTMTGIKFLDKKENVLINTVGEGYSDLTTPEAFLVTHFRG